MQETMQSEMAVLLENPEEIITYSCGGAWPLSWRNCWSAGQRRWPHWGTGKTKGQMAFHYSSAKYAASIKIKSLVWGAAAKLTDQLSCGRRSQKRSCS